MASRPSAASTKNAYPEHAILLDFSEADGQAVRSVLAKELSESRGFSNKTLNITPPAGKPEIMDMFAKDVPASSPPDLLLEHDYLCFALGMNGAILKQSVLHPREALADPSRERACIVLICRPENWIQRLGNGILSLFRLR